MTCNHPANKAETKILLTECPGCGAECSGDQIGDDQLCYDELCPLHVFEGHAVPEGWSLYLGSDAGNPELHGAKFWYFQPDDVDTSGIYSQGYPSREAAAQACERWISTQAIEAGAREQENDRLASEAK